MAARTSISIFSPTLCAKPPCERSTPRLPSASNGRRSCYRRAYLPTGIPLSPVQEALTISTPKHRLGERWAVPSRGEEPQGESHDPDEASKINASPRVFEGVFHHSGCDCSQ